MGGGSPEEQNAKDVPVHITTIVLDDETLAGQMNFTQNSKEALHRRSISSGKKGLRASPGRRNTE